jgi:protein TonB
LRRPLLLSQVTDTLTTARDLLRAKKGSAATAALAAAAGAAGGSAAGASTLSGVASTVPDSVVPPPGQEKTLRAGEFLQRASSTPGGQFETDSQLHESLRPSSVEPIDPLHDLEPTAAAVAASSSEARPAEVNSAEAKPAPAAGPPAGEPRGLQWYLKTRAAAMPQAAAAAPAPAPTLGNPELIGFEQTPAYSAPAPASLGDSVRAPAAEPRMRALGLPERQREPEPTPEKWSEKKLEPKKEAQGFSSSYGATNSASEGSESEATPRRSFRMGKGMVAIALFLASCAVLAAPQAPWHQKLHPLWVRGQQSLHAWLNPQVVTTPQAPMPHEDFGRAGDEYKLPAAENIPDATTDPSQIHVVPVIDPTAKKPNNEGANAEAPAGQGDAPAPASTQGDQPSGSATSGAASTPATTQPVSGPAASGTSAAPAATQPAEAQPASTQTPPPSAAPAVVSPPASLLSPIPSGPAPPVPQKSAQSQPPPHYASAPSNVPSSLKSQMASMTPDASGNKPPEAAMQSIEPVNVSEAAERALLTDQPAVDYPAGAKGQPGTVTLQVLIGRDGAVQDAKFMQGSLVFAKAAIEGVKQWKFKPYSMNGRPVSVQTLLTINFKAGS